MTDVVQLPSTAIPSGPAGHAPSLSLSALLAERFLRTASCLVSPTTSDPRGLPLACTQLLTSKHTSLVPTTT